MKKLFILAVLGFSGVAMASSIIPGCKNSRGICKSFDFGDWETGPKCSEMGLNSCRFPGGCQSFDGQPADQSKCDYAKKLNRYIKDYLISSEAIYGTSESGFKSYLSNQGLNADQIYNDIYVNHKSNYMNVKPGPGCILNGKCTVIDGSNYICPNGGEKCHIFISGAVREPRVGRRVPLLMHPTEKIDVKAVQVQNPTFQIVEPDSDGNCPSGFGKIETGALIGNDFICVKQKK